MLITSNGESPLYCETPEDVGTVVRDWVAANPGKAVIFKVRYVALSQDEYDKMEDYAG